MSSIDINISSIDNSSVDNSSVDKYSVDNSSVDKSSVDINISTKTSFKINIKLPTLKSGISINMFNLSPTKNSSVISSAHTESNFLIDLEKTPEKKTPDKKKYEKEVNLTPIGENWFGDTPDEVKRKFLLEDKGEDDQSLDTPFLDRNVNKKSNIEIPLSLYRDK